MVSLRRGFWDRVPKINRMQAISEGHGDTALVLLRAGAETDKKDVDGNLAIDLAPDKKVTQFCSGINQNG